MHESRFNWKKKQYWLDCLNYSRKQVKDMVDMARGIFTSHSSLRAISDEALDDIIRNTQANQASLTKFYNALINERVRRGLKLPTPRVQDEP